MNRVVPLGAAIRRLLCSGAGRASQWRAADGYVGGVKEPRVSGEVWDLVVVGAGPAGAAAA
jgi:hypothetical protein